MSKISIIIPCFNEEGNINILAEKLQNILSEYKYEIIFIDDGSTDKSLQIIKEISFADDRIKYISFTRNFGHQNALKAGIDNASGDCVISLDADLQHPPELIPEMIKYWEENYDVVYTQRLDQKKESFFKKISSRIFYKIINKLSDVKIESGTADYRLINRNVIEVIKQIDDTDLFLRGLIPWSGFKSKKIVYTPNERFSGKTKYSIRKMFSLGLNGITSFSIKPLRISIFIGLIFSILAFLYVIFAVYKYFFTNDTVEGWTSMLASTMLIGGIQLIMLGIIGEYLGKLFMQSKKRPNYIIKDKSTN
jgi:dolichol-phosphate mannosyltransferase